MPARRPGPLSPWCGWSASLLLFGLLGGVAAEIFAYARMPGVIMATLIAAAAVFGAVLLLIGALLMQACAAIDPDEDHTSDEPLSSSR